MEGGRCAAWTSHQDIAKDYQDTGYNEDAATGSSEDEGALSPTHIV